MTFSSKDIEAAYPKLQFYARKLTKGVLFDAEDLLHDTLLKMLENSASYVPSHKNSAEKWGASIMHNLYIDHVRKDSKMVGRFVYLSQKPRMEVPELALRDTEHVKIVHETFRKVRRVLRESPWSNKHLPIFLMRSMGLSYKEIADKLQVNLGTLKARIFRMREESVSLCRKHKVDVEV